MKTLVVSHVTLVISYPVVTVGPVRVMGAGVVMRPCVVEVSTLYVYVYDFLSVTCIVPCPALTDPNNGTITCSLGDDGVPSYEDTCSFTCNTGYELTGSDTRTCQSDGNWSGNETMCSRGGYTYV